MDLIEDEIIDEEYNGLRKKEDRQRLAKHLYKENKEYEEIIDLAKSAIIKKVYISTK